MTAYAIEERRLTPTLTVYCGVEITCPALADPRYTRGVIDGAWIVDGNPVVRIYYGPFSEVRRLDPDGRPI